MLDTNMASAAMRGIAAVDAKLRSLASDQWCISVITRAELRYGVALRPDATRLAALVEAFLAASVTLNWTEEAADRHGLIRAQLRARGEPIGAFDEMIAAQALATGLIVVTDNTRHFERIDGLRLENWLRPSERQT